MSVSLTHIKYKIAKATELLEKYYYKIVQNVGISVGLNMLFKTKKDLERYTKRQCPLLLEYPLSVSPAQRKCKLVELHDFAHTVVSRFPVPPPIQYYNIMNFNL